MSETTKVYPGLTSVARETTYHLGFYEVEFPDGELRFELHARICPTPSCLCDNIAIDWCTEGRVTSTWYTAEREFRDGQHQPLAQEMVEVFRIVEATDKFRERYSHLVFLRRRQVLEELQRFPEAYSLRIPEDLLGADTDLKKHVLGQFRPGARGGKSLPYALEFCGDSECYCNALFLVVRDGRTSYSFSIDPKGQWSAMADSPEAARLLQRLEPRLGRDDLFRRQLAFFRTERMLQNYHRFATQYLATHRVGL